MTKDTRKTANSPNTSIVERPSMSALAHMSTDELCITTIRTLAMDAVQKANSGHPGTAMALAPLAYILWTRHLRHNPRNPDWFNRDRFVLSNGHASILQYALLYLTGYDLSLEDIKQFRQLESRTPGHPENFLTAGVETTTGPLGQGLTNAVGMAIAEAHLAAVFNRDAHAIIDHHTYAFCSDGDMMEGASHEAASLAGHLGLSKLIWVYDDNHITIDGRTDLTFSEDVAKRFESYGWHVQDLGEKANNLEALDQALAAARSETRRPSLVIVRSHIGYGAPTKQDTPEAHGEPLGEEEIRLTKRFYGWPEREAFLVPAPALEHMRGAVTSGRTMEEEWKERYARYKQTHPELAAQFEAAVAGTLPDDWGAGIPQFRPADGPLATRAASGTVLNAIARRVPWLIGGSADLAGSNNTLLKNAESSAFAKHEYGHRNIYWGVREHVMCGACSGMALHGGVRPYAATFFIFTDYARPAIRLAAIMRLPVIYVLTHDSIGLGEDGTTHQPVEHLASFRAMPGIRIIRPADANEAAEAWRVAIERPDGPTMLILTRQKIPVFDRRSVADAAGLRRGAYVLSKEQGKWPDVILIGTGSEVQLLLEAQHVLSDADIKARVVSMPSWELFREQPLEYRDEVLPPAIKARVAVEAGVPQGWSEWVGEAGDVIGLTHFGLSAPGTELFGHFGFTVQNVVASVRRLLNRPENDRS